MIREILSLDEEVPFLYEEVGNILISDNPIVIDLLFLENINAMVLKNFSVFEAIPRGPFLHNLEITSKEDLKKITDLGLSEEFSLLLFDLLKELKSSLIGVQLTSAMKRMCPNIHTDKLPLRIVQCLDGDGTTLMTSKNEELYTNKNDLIFIKGETWKTNCGALKHKSPDSCDLRRLLRIDFLD